MKKLIPLIFLLMTTNIVSASDTDWSGSSMSPVNENTIRVFNLDFAPNPTIYFNVDFVFNDTSLSFEPNLSTLSAIDKTKYKAADAVRGGLLYDKWWLINGASEPVGNHPLYPTDIGRKSGSVTWRCKECHGWDYKGNEGAYEEGSSHFTDIKGVFNAKNKTVGELADIIAKKNLGLSEQDILNLTKFIKEGLVDMNKYIAFTGAFSKVALGDTASGNTLYSGFAGCSNCHGTDGKTITGLALGEISNRNPWETLHKIRHGHPGSGMPAMITNGLTVQEMVDVLTYSQTLPQQ